MDDGEILQVMPWNVYGKMTQFDLRAIYEYLSAIPPLSDNPAPGPSTFGTTAASIRPPAACR